ncbi:MAG: alpha-amylase family glycosyl hydrolase [Bacteriovoracaceae bacterium]
MKRYQKHAFRPKTLALFFTLLSLSFSAYAADWRDSFYTDDSEYFQKLTSTGFKQLFKIQKNHCHQVRSIEVVIPNAQRQIKPPKQSLKKLSLGELKNSWPKLYGSKDQNFCWLEINFKNHNWRTTPNLSYSFRISTGPSTYLWNGLEWSLLPKKRLVNNLKFWNHLGKFGATKVENGGVLFKIWEPSAEKVFLTFKSKRYPMKVSNIREVGHKFHSLYLPYAKPNDAYQFEFQKNGKLEVLEVANKNRMSAIKVDPYARELSYDAKGGKNNGYIDPRAHVAPLMPYPWQHDNQILNQAQADYDNWLIYQIWPLTFNPKKVNGKYVQGTYKDIVEKLDYVRSLGVNAVELLPVNENRFYASWGYALDSLFLLTKEYGSRQELKYLVDQIHKRDMRVIFDVVINHINNFLLRDPLTETNDQSKFYDGNTDWGPRPRFSSIMVRKWILDALLTLKRDFHVDGFRFDMIEVAYRNNPPAYEFIQEMNQVLKHDSSRFYLSAEQLPDNVWATYPIDNNGLGFDSQWNDKFKNAFETELDHYRPWNRDLDLLPLQGSLRGYSNHNGGLGEFKFGPPLRTVNYIGSHDFIGNKDPILRLASEYEQYESDGKNYFYRVRPLNSNQQKETSFRVLHSEFTHDLARTAYGVLFTKPGSLLFFQGEEAGNDINIENEWSYVDAIKNNTTPSKNVNIDKYVASHRMVWEYVEAETSPALNFLSLNEKRRFTGQVKFFKEMLKLRSKLPEWNERDPNYVDLIYGGKVLSYHIQNSKGEYLVVANFGHDLTDAWLHFPGDSQTWWQETYNSSSPEFGGSTGLYQNVIAQVGGRDNQIRLKGPAVAIFEKTKRPKMQEKLFVRGTFNDWKLTSELRASSDKGDLYVAGVSVTTSGSHRFKVANANWDIELSNADSIHQQNMQHFLATPSGNLSYVSRGDDVTLHLDAGRYNFIFNIRTFKFSFIRL